MEWAAGRVVKRLLSRDLTSSPMRFSLALSLVLAVVLAGCDSAGIVLNSQYYVGSWTLVSVSDEGGDRTEEVLAAIDDFDVDFDPDGSFVLDVDFNVVVNAAGQDDIRLPGDYQATETTLVLLLEGGIAASFFAEAESESRVLLTVPTALISQILGSELGIDFDGDVTLGLRRQ